MGNNQLGDLGLVCFEYLAVKRAPPTGPFTISEPQNQEISEFVLVQKSRATDYEAPNF